MTRSRWMRRVRTCLSSLVAFFSPSKVLSNLHHQYLPDSSQVSSQQLAVCARAQES